MTNANCLVIGLTILVATTTPVCAREDAGAKAKRKKRDVSAEFFSTRVVPHLRIEISDADLAGLRKDDRDYVPCTIREGGSVYSEVGVHLKGGPGSFRGLDDRPSLTLNFDKFVADQKFHGMDKLHLNNSVQDATYVMEIICGDLFRAAGVPAPRGTHARVELNGRDLGLYVLKEGSAGLSESIKYGSALARRGSHLRRRVRKFSSDLGRHARGRSLPGG